MKAIYLNDKQLQGASYVETAKAIKVTTADKQKPRKVKVFARKAMTLKGGGRLDINIPKNTTIAIPVTVPSNLKIHGQASFAAKTGNSGIQTVAWFSWYPGGKAFTGRDNSSQKGTSTNVIKWSVEKKKNRIHCPLPKGRKIYLNIAAVDRNVSTGVYLHRY